MRPSAAVRRSAALTAVSGAVRHAATGTVTVTVEVRRGRRWRTAATLSLRVSGAGRFASLVRMHRAGVYRFIAVYTGAAGYRPSSSGYHLLVMHRR